MTWHLSFSDEVRGDYTLRAIQIGAFALFTFTVLVKSITVGVMMVEKAPSLLHVLAVLQLQCTRTMTL